MYDDWELQDNDELLKEIDDGKASNTLIEVCDNHEVFVSN